MIGKFFSCAIFFVIISGLALHFEAEIPYFSSWAGHLPGDLILKKGKALIYLPFTTAAIISAGLSLLGSLFSKKN
jgi:hypothetical protein